MTSISSSHRDSDFRIGLENGSVGLVNFSKNISPQLSSRSEDDDDERAELKKSSDRYDGSENKISPIVYRFFFALFGVLGGFFLALCCPDDERQLVRAAWFGGCCLLGVA